MRTLCRIAYRIAFLGLVFAPFLASAAPLGTTFTYQGQLQASGAAANGSFDFEFLLYDAVSSGTLLGTETLSNVSVDEGLFTVELDFGTVYAGDALFLEIRVRDAGAGSYTTLSPRQPLTAAPYALFALAGNEGPPGPAGPEGPQGPEGPPGASVFSETGDDASFTGGNLGVGTDTPTAALEVQGNFSQTLTGNVTVGAGSTTVNGVGTLFTSELIVGDPIIIAGESFTVATINSDTELFLDAAHSSGALNAPAFTGGDLLRVRDASGTVKITADRNGNLQSSASICDQNGCIGVAASFECVTRESGGFGEATVQCETGWQMTGGGCQENNASRLRHSRPTLPNGWSCEYDNSFGVTAYARCCRLILAP